jgi:hypothetical protein
MVNVYCHISRELCNRVLATFEVRSHCDRRCVGRQSCCQTLLEPKARLSLDTVLSMRGALSDKRTALTNNTNTYTFRRTSQETHCISATETSRLMLCGETVAVYCENRTEHTDTPCRENAELLISDAGGRYCGECRVINLRCWWKVL